MSQRTLWRILPLLFCCTVAVGCNNFYNRQQSQNLTTTSFDTRLPKGISEVFTTCHKTGFLIFPDQAASSLANKTGKLSINVDLRGSCPLATSLASVQGQSVYAAAASNSPMLLSFNSPLFHPSQTHFSGFPWPLQNCSVGMDSEVYFWGISFKTLSTEWVTHKKTPALKLSLGNSRLSSGYKLAYSQTIATANCPSPINQGLLRSKLDNAGVNGLQNIDAQDVDLDLYFMFELNNGAIRVSVDAKLLLSNIFVAGIDWDELPKSAKTQFDAQIGSLTNEVSSGLTSQFQSFSALLAGPMQSAVPAGDVICSIEVQNGQLVITSRNPAVKSNCLRAVRV